MSSSLLRADCAFTAWPGFFPGLMDEFMPLEMDRIHVSGTKSYACVSAVRVVRYCKVVNTGECNFLIIFPSESATLTS
jgi:hypothetical protein